MTRKPFDFEGMVRRAAQFGVREIVIEQPFGIDSAQLGKSDLYLRTIFGNDVDLRAQWARVGCAVAPDA